MRSENNHNRSVNSKRPAELEIDVRTNEEISHVEKVGVLTITTSKDEIIEADVVIEATG